MGYLSHRVDRDEIKPGDHIYTWRTAFTYAHHGIYVGENKVIHFTSDQENAMFGAGWNLSASIPIPSSCLNPINSELSHPISGHSCGCDSGSGSGSGSCLCTYSCGFHQPDSGVTISCLNCFVGTGSLYLYQYGVNKCVQVSKIRGGTCTIAPSDPPGDVVDRAIYLFKQRKGFGDYNVYKNNCEDFALYCKTGLMVCGKRDTGGSGQVNFIANAPWKPVLVSLVQKAVSSTPTSPLTVVVTVGAYCWKRYKTDIGVRGDAVKVGVQEVGSFRSRGY